MQRQRRRPLEPAPRPRHASPGSAWSRSGPIANAPWRFAERPTGHYAELYWERLRELSVDPGDLGWSELALRFSAYAPGVHTAIVGTANPANLAANVAAAARGPLPAEVLAELDAAWARVGQDWPSST